MKLRAGSLFSGYGGLDLAVQEVFGAEVAWHCEWEAAPSAILEHHWPGVPNLHDVTEVDWTTVPPVDILTGGFPCQPFSAAGKREGENDERHLWPYVLEAIRALRPRYTILENVAGLRSIGATHEEPAYGCVCGWIGRRGRLHHREVDEVWHRDGHQGSGWDGDEGKRAAREDAPGVWRNLDHAIADESEAFGHRNLDRHGSGGGDVSAPDRATSNPEGGAGSVGVADRGDSYLAAADREQGSLSMDSGLDGSVPGALPTADGVERPWQFVGDIDPAAGWGGDCPACGRSVGDQSGRHVFRSGLGTVFRDLASMGMHVRWTSIRASDIGAPHHRERLFILVTPADAESARPQRDELSWRPRTPLARPIGDRGVLTHPGDDGREGCPERDRYSAAGIAASRWDDSDRRGDSASDTGCSTVWEQPGGASTEEAGSDASDGSVDHRGERPPRVGREGSSESEGIGRDGRRSAPRQEEGSHTAAGGCSTGIDWGAYAPAVRRWERLTRPAPAPTEPNRNGRPRLSAAFAEWMMGLPAGWVTDPAIGISRAEQLKAIGNGVCPQQAVAALQSMRAIERHAAHI